MSNNLINFVKEEWMKKLLENNAKLEEFDL